MKIKIPKVEEMLEAGVHFGHQVRRWNPKMEKYIYTVSKNIHIIDLEQTEQKLKEACEFVYKKAAEGGRIIFVGTKKQAREIIVAEAKRCGAMYVSERWIGGTITNSGIIRKTLDKHLKMIKERDEGIYLTTRTKKERLLIDRSIDKFQLVYGGIANMREIPSALVIVDQKREHTAIQEAKRFDIPVVGIIDTNADPTQIDYAIPANDDAIKSVALLVKTLATAIEEGYKEYEKTKEEEKTKKAKPESK